jgi:hypothetical protein
METLIFVCFLIIICLLVHDKKSAKKVTQQNNQADNTVPHLHEIIGRPKSWDRPTAPSNTIKSQEEKTAKGNASFV